MPEPALTRDEHDLLLDLAESAIRDSLDGLGFPGPEPTALPDSLLRPGGAFVTLHVAGDLNGCIGNLESADPIGHSVPRLAIEAAFEDPRLPVLRQVDLDHLHVEVSLLSPRSSIPATTRAMVIDRLRVSVDGLIIGSGSNRAVFLPAVWEQLPEPDHFLDQLLRKAGLSQRTWPYDMTAEVFATSSFGRHVT